METNVIKEEGYWQHDIFGETCWDINYSSILTKLIQYAGRYCEDYASDLFIQWNCNIEKNLKDRNWEGGEFVFGFRAMGVDHKEWIQHYKNTPYYYRKIAILTVTIDDDKITMELKG